MESVLGTIIVICVLIWYPIHQVRKGMKKAEYKQKKYGTQLGRWWW